MGYNVNETRLPSVAEKFLETMCSMAEKLSFVASAYADGHFHIYPLKYGHSVKFIVIADAVIIADFLPKGANWH